MSASSKLLRPVGYALTFASLCSMLAVPATQATAEETGSGTGMTTTKSNHNVANAKREVVHAVTSAGGSVNDIEVTTTLETGGNTSVADSTNLHRLTLTDEDVYASNEGELVWHSPDGRDITYTGYSNTALPMQVKVTYSLDGQTVSPSELPGRSGHLAIRYDYLDSEVQSTGKATHTPFAAVTVVTLNKDVFANVKVTNGSTSTDKDGNTVVTGSGVTATAAGEDTESQTGLPTYFEVEADVSNFHIGRSMTVASSNLLEALSADMSQIKSVSKDFDKTMEEYLKKIEELRKTVEEQQKAAEKLAERLKGTSELAKTLDQAATEVTNAASAIDGVNAQASSVYDYASAASQASESFLYFLQTTEDLDETQRTMLIDKWNEMGVAGYVAQIQSDATTLRDNAVAMDFAYTTEASEALSAVDFDKLAEDSKKLSDQLKELLEKGIGSMEKKDEKDTLFYDTTKLQEELVKKLSAQVELPSSTAAGLASGTLELTPKVSAQETTTEEAAETEAGMLSKINKVMDEVFDQSDANAAASTSADTSSLKPYTNYGGITEGTTGSVQFVFDVAGIN